MKSSQKVVLELKKLNKRIDMIGAKGNFMVYTANPWKFAFYNFIAGIFHSLGSLFGTVVVAAAIIYFLSQINFTNSLNTWVQNLTSQINWEQIIPTQKP
ncbi:MAG: DUF5665 domain-containing protein [Candidatus Shapirobacteria bacterium]|nr:DUF5665 domain-containing protein [Candidatus Shapirobacteria bacterium]